MANGGDLLRDPIEPHYNKEKDIAGHFIGAQNDISHDIMGYGQIWLKNRNLEKFEICSSSVKFGICSFRCYRMV